MRLLMIHGIAQGGLDWRQLRSTWTATLREGFDNAGRVFPERVDIDFPYYGDILDGFVAKSKLPTSAEVAAKGPGQNSDYEQFMKSALVELQGHAGISDAEVSAQVENGGVQQKGPQNWWWVRAIARAIDKRNGNTSTALIEDFLREVYLYIAAPAVQQKIDETVEAMLTDEPTLVIGHSLGSVVGYNVIKKHHATVPFVQYLTVGSPLGVRAISTKLGLAQNPLGKQGWYNAFDKRDIVALNPLDDRNFPADPAIINDDRVNNPTDNRHGIIGYLNDPHVAQQAAAALL
jgi:hypothetical protein